jgi:two-component system chemotaxis response regulator CheY
VLIVDDHPSFRQLASRLLGEAGFAVVGEAADAGEAVREAARLRPDVVLLDVVLPDRSGVDVAADLAHEIDGPLVVLTSSRSRSDFGESFDWPAGCSFVPKHELSAARLRAVLQRP